MLSLGSQTKIVVLSAPVDMRRSHDGLASMVQGEMGKNPRDGSCFVFFNKRANRVKILYWDRHGYSLWYKRLESGCFALPKIKPKQYALDAGELSLLLEGVSLTTSRLAHDG